MYPAPVVLHVGSGSGAASATGAGIATGAANDAAKRPRRIVIVMNCIFVEEMCRMCYAGR